MTVNGRPNTEMMPGLECSPNGSVWTNFANFRLFFNRQALGYFGLVFRYDFRWKLQENLATLSPSHVTSLDAKSKQSFGQLNNVFANFS